MLVALMYHRIGEGRHANPYPLFKEHLSFLKNRAPIVLPGDPLSKKGLSICLTFDDATYDFYHYVFPLLKKMNVRALLGVPVRYIQERTTLDPEIRLSVPYALAMQDSIFEEKVPHCTWEELYEMVSSGLVQVASHSYSHANLTFPFIDHTQEIIASKKILEEKLPQSISSFIYPFGKTDAGVHALVREHYTYAFRIGSALNRSWYSPHPLARILGDHLTSASAPLRLSNLMRAYCKHVLERISSRASQKSARL